MRSSETQSSLPNFVVIGAAGAGTATLHDWLAEHPDICMSARKDLDFFLEKGNWHRGVGWYRLRFAPCTEASARGDSSPHYANTHVDPKVPERMHSVIPGARFIYLVREPIELMRSMYRQKIVDGSEKRSFQDAVIDDPDYRETSRYILHIGAFLKHYPKDRFLVISTEQLATDPGAALAAVHTHLRVPPMAPSADALRDDVVSTQRIESTMSRNLKANPGYWRALNRSWRLRGLHERVFTRSTRVAPTELSSGVEAELYASLEKDTKALEVFVGRRLTEWGR